ncbi:hypothetical protein [Breoghania sp.]|uniref:hypothetical protein n=1 Tax=Breoghania sp. TaxID=2065378 RepID=UPI00262D0497|nr:hypothetical protein [Breoghania sp.]MDJ0929583.1 hypothetical protein [Breoghania sp.]
MADGRDILIRAPRPGRVCEPLFPVGLTVDKPTPFITLAPIAESIPLAPESEADPAPTVEPQAIPPEATETTPPSAISRKLAAAALSFGEILITLLAAFLICETLFADFFEDHILARWGLILATFLVTIWVAGGLEHRIHPGRNPFSTGATVTCGLLAVAMMMPANLVSETLEDSGIHVDLSPDLLFKQNAYGVVLEDLENYSNGNPTKPTARQAQNFASWLNDEFS